ncbi:uncharacterized protein LOC128509144 isoform X1 [Clarias gariepinus]|uniref:uncharacterized protein LOC128509144 isoform X1 n=2 Tax=Clarias gariepinus TaxID=13013 RepID=UPI00234E026D|nr:uncharacterized protein LOC128509144 isoform X1 [Clarias gariepinus]
MLAEDVTPCSWREELCGVGVICGVFYYLYTKDPVQRFSKTVSSIEVALKDQENEARCQADPSLMFKKQNLSLSLRFKIYMANNIISKQKSVLSKSQDKKIPNYLRARSDMNDLQRETSDLISQISRLQETVNRLNTENCLYSKWHKSVVSEKKEYHQKLLIQEANIKLKEKVFSELYKKECEDNKTLKENYERALESNFHGKLKISELKNQITKLQCLVQELNEQNCEADTKCDAINQESAPEQEADSNEYAEMKETTH